MGPGCLEYMNDTYHLICPDRCLGLKLRTISHLQGTGAATRKEVGDLFPGQVLLLFQVDE